ncbi:MAG: SDR family oxidoreductase [Limnochordia bacterium]|nr:SDR family oxidoreductase [Limnochordia bacterium]
MAVYLVTGGAGFIGSNIVETLLENGANVRVLDNLSTGKAENLREYQDDIEFINGDIRDLERCQKACKGVDYVLHQAALGSVPRSIEAPKTTNDVNISGTLNMLVAARDQDVQRFVYASSSSVYGDDPNLPKKEDRVGRVLSPYALTKKTNEIYARLFFELYGLPTIGLRYFNVFGKRQDPHSAYAAVIPKFVRRLINDQPGVIYGDGQQSRDFTHVSNVIQANLLACSATAPAFGQVFNIACGSSTTVLELYEKISNLLGKSITPEFRPPRKGDVKHSNADVEKAIKFLRYEPKINIDQGLEMTIDWYVNNL